MYSPWKIVAFLSYPIPFVTIFRGKLKLAVQLREGSIFEEHITYRLPWDERYIYLHFHGWFLHIFTVFMYVNIPFVPWWPVWVPCSSEHSAEKIPRMRLPTTPWWRWRDLDVSSTFSNKKTWGPCGVLGPSMLEDGPVIFWMQQFWNMFFLVQRAICVFGLIFESICDYLSVLACFQTENSWVLYTYNAASEVQTKRYKEHLLVSNMTTHISSNSTYIYRYMYAFTEFMATHPLHIFINRITNSTSRMFSSTELQKLQVTPSFKQRVPALRSCICGRDHIWDVICAQGHAFAWEAALWFASDLGFAWGEAIAIGRRGTGFVQCRDGGVLCL